MNANCVDCEPAGDRVATLDPVFRRIDVGAAAGLPQPATMAAKILLPDAGAADAAAIRVPVLLAFGDGDMHDRPHAAPTPYTGSHDVTSLVLADTRHNHFIYPGRTALFDRVGRWAAAQTEAACVGDRLGPDDAASAALERDANVGTRPVPA